MLTGAKQNISSKRTEYRVKWAGCRDDDPVGTTWEPESGVEHTEALEQCRGLRRAAVTQG